jgi:hypothetical protein
MLHSMIFCFLLLLFFMVFNATFNNISEILWRSVLLVEETEGPGPAYKIAEKLLIWRLKAIAHSHCIVLFMNNFISSQTISL